MTNMQSGWILVLRNYFGNHDRGLLLTLLATALGLYLPFAGSPFIFDDLPFFGGDNISFFSGMPRIWDLRWLSYGSLGWTWAFFSDAPHAYHLGNALLHGGNVILLFFLLRRLIRTGIADCQPSVANWGAWFGALIFAMHPVAAYAVGYAVQRSILMATFFSLAMQLAYLRGLLGGQVRWLVLTVAAYYLAVFSKEQSVLMPAVLLAETVWLRAAGTGILGSGILASKRALLLTWAALFATGLLIILRAKGVFGTPYEAMAAFMFEQQGVAAPEQHLLSAMTQAGLFFKYLLLWLLPVPAWMSIDMREPFVSSLTAWAGWLGAIGFAAYGLVGVRLIMRPRHAGLIGLAMLYPWLLFVLEFSTVRVQEIFVLYRSYLWMPGIMLLFPLLLSRWPGRRTVLAMGLAALLLAPLTINRLWVLADPYRLWDDAARLLTDERAGGADRIFYNRGNAALSAHKAEEAIADFQRAAAISPQLAPIHYALGIAYYNAGHYQEAVAQFDIQIKLDPSNGQAYYAKGVALRRLHEDELALQMERRACELKNAVACAIVRSQKPAFP